MYLGIEIGGSKLQLGIGLGDGKLAGLWRGTVDVAAGAEGIRRQITQAVPELLSQANLDRSQIKGVGIGFGGPVDDATRTVIKSHQIEGWDNFPLAEWIGDMLGWPAVLGNDADVAGLAEALFGAGKGLSPIFYITIGSGIGGGLIIDAEIYRGCGRGAAEIGHLLMAGEYWTGRAFFDKPLEQLASGWAIEEIAKLWAKADPELSQSVRKLVEGDLQQITAHHIGLAASQGDRFAVEVLKEVLPHLRDAICHVITFLCPRRIIIGGGVSLMGEQVLFEPLRTLVQERVFKPFADCYDIVPAVLGEEVVVHGALALTHKRLGGE